MTDPIEGAALEPKMLDGEGFDGWNPDELPSWLVRDLAPMMATARSRKLADLLTALNRAAPAHPSGEKLWEQVGEAVSRWLVFFACRNKAQAKTFTQDGLEVADDLLRPLSIVHGEERGEGVDYWKRLAYDRLRGWNEANKRIRKLIPSPPPFAVPGGNHARLAASNDFDWIAGEADSGNPLAVLKLIEADLDGVEGEEGHVYNALDRIRTCIRQALNRPATSEDNLASVRHHLGIAQQAVKVLRGKEDGREFWKMPEGRTNIELCLSNNLELALSALSASPADQTGGEGT